MLQNLVSRWRRSPPSVGAIVYESWPSSARPVAQTLALSDIDLLMEFEPDAQVGFDLIEDAT